MALPRQEFAQGRDRIFQNDHLLLSFQLCRCEIALDTTLAGAFRATMFRLGLMRGFEWRRLQPVGFGPRQD
jgi:hypothetical protein